MVERTASCARSAPTRTNPSARMARIVRPSMNRGDGGRPAPRGLSACRVPPRTSNAPRFQRGVDNITQPSELVGSVGSCRRISGSYFCTLCQLPVVGAQFLTGRNGFARAILTTLFRKRVSPGLTFPGVVSGRRVRPRARDERLPEAMPHRTVDLALRLNATVESATEPFCCSRIPPPR
jgi:hypothetical protein